jgi:hypothetical protein
MSRLNKQATSRPVCMSLLVVLSKVKWRAKSANICCQVLCCCHDVDFLRLLVELLVRAWSWYLVLICGTPSDALNLVMTYGRKQKRDIKKYFSKQWILQFHTVYNKKNENKYFGWLSYAFYIVIIFDVQSRGDRFWFVLVFIYIKKPNWNFFYKNQNRFKPTGFDSV